MDYEERVVPAEQNALGLLTDEQQTHSALLQSLNTRLGVLLSANKDGPRRRDDGPHSDHGGEAMPW